MITYSEACAVAFGYFQAKDKVVGLATAMEVDMAWIFYGGSVETANEIGIQGILVDKTTGVVSDFILPSQENFALLDASQKVDVPEIYRGQAAAI